MGSPAVFIEELSLTNDTVCRSVQVTANKPINYAYTVLKNVLRDCNVRGQVRMQSRFESNPSKRRRLRREREWKAYLAGMKIQVSKAFDLKNRYLWAALRYVYVTLTNRSTLAISRLQQEKKHHKPI